MLGAAAGLRATRQGRRAAGRGREAGDIDRVAAVLLLQSYLDERNG